MKKNIIVYCCLQLTFNITKFSLLKYIKLLGMLNIMLANVIEELTYR